MLDLWGQKKDERSSRSISPMFSVFSVFLFLYILLFMNSTFSLTLEEAIPQWAPYTAIALAFGFGIVVIAYFLSSVFHLSELNAWAKTEFGEVTGSAFLIIIILLTVSLANSIFSAATGGTPSKVSQDFLKQLSGKLEEIYKKGIEESFYLSAVSGATPQFMTGGYSRDIEKWKDAIVKAKQEVEKGEAAALLPILFFALNMFSPSYSSYPAGWIFNNYINTLMSSVFVSLFIADIAKEALSLIDLIALPVVVPFGLFLSTFALTRKLGRTLIAIGICLYFFAPASVLITKVMYEGVNKFTPPSNSIEFQGGRAFYRTQIAQVSSMIPYYFVTEGAGSIAWKIATILTLCIPLLSTPFTAPLFPACLLVANFIGGFIAWPAATWVQYSIEAASHLTTFINQFGVVDEFGNEISSIILNWIPYSMQYVIPALLIPLVMFIVIITAIRSVSPAIGGEIQILGVSELI